MTFQAMGTASPMEHQREDVERMVLHPRINVWNGLGTGKTCTVAWWLQEKFLRGAIDTVVLVLPGMLVPDWRMTLMGMACPEGMVEFIDCRPPDAGLIEELLTCGMLVNPGRLTVLATTYGGLRRLVVERQGSRSVVRQSNPLFTHLRGRRVAVVFDESQFAALPTSDQGRACRSFAASCSAVASITATPIGNPKSMRLWGLARLVRPDVLMAHPPPDLDGQPAGVRGSFDAFKARYGILEDPVARRMRGQQRRIAARSFVVEVFQHQIEQEVLAPMAPFTCRRRKEDCLDLPDKVYLRRAYRASARVQRLMDDLIEHDRAILDSGTAVVPSNALEERLRTIELTGGWAAGEAVHDAKLALLEQVLAEISENIGERTPRCVWASRSRELVACALIAAGAKPSEAQARASLCYPPGGSIASPSVYREIVERCVRARVGIIHGPTPKRERDRIIDRYRGGDVRTLVMHPSVGGAGLNLQWTRAMVYYSQPLGSISRRQSEDRMHRKGLAHLALYYDLLMDGGPDEAVLASHRSERDVALSLLDWMRQRIAS